MFEDAQAGVEAGRAGNFGWVVGVDRTGQAEALKRRGADVVVAGPRRADQAGMIGQEVFAVEPWVVRERELRDDAAAAERVDLRALQRAHRPARQPRRGRAGRRARARSSTRSSRSAPAALRGGRLRLSRGGPDAHQRHQRQADPAARRRRAVRRPLRARWSRHERVLDLRDGVLRREVEWVSPAGQGVRVRSTRLVSFVQRSVAAIRYEVEPLEAGARIVVQSELVANEPVPGESDDPRAAAALRAPLVSEHHGHHELRAGLIHRTQARAACGWRRRWTTSSTGTDDVSTAAESEADLARVTITHGARARPDAARRQVARLRLVEPALAARRCATRSRRRSRPRAGRAGTACAAASASTSTTSGPARTSSSTATSRSSRRCASRSSTCSRPARARRSARSRPRA